MMSFVRLRKCFLGVLCLGLVFGGILIGCDDEEENSPYDQSFLRTVTGGLILGVADSYNTQVFKGIPYASPPIGNLRWRAPQNAQSWQGVKDADQFGNMCAQVGSYFGDPDPSTFGQTIGNEDCLSLNLWRPVSSDTKLPVMLWIHGGANLKGTANDPLYNGAHFSSFGNVIFIGVNHRIGNLGWFTHPALKTGNNKDDSGNFATLDLIKALEWIQNNIEEFGGDPNRITIAGQSAGCMNVWGLLQSPLADGKFHRAICSSGIPNAYPPATGYIQSGDLLNKLLIKDGYASNTIEAIAFAAQQSNTWIADYLRSQPVEELVTRAPSPVIFGHFTDGTVIRTGGYASLIAGNYNKVPLMLGSTKDEGTLFTSLLGFYKPDLVELWDMINNDPTNLEVSNIVKDEVYPFYAPLHETLSFALNLTIDNVMRYLRLIDGHLVSSDLYRYNMNWDSIPVPWKEVFGAAHGIDIPFFLGNFTTDEPSFVNFAWSESNRLQREALSAVMMTYFAEFMRTGNPNASGDGLPTWSDWSNFFIFNKRMIFDNNYHMSSYDFFNVDFMNLYNNLQVDQQALTNQMEEDYQLRLDDSDVSYQ